MKKESNIFKLSFLLLLYLGFILLLYSLIALLKLPINLNFINIISALSPMIILCIFESRIDRKKIVLIISYLLIIILLPLVYNFTFDSSCDGNSYHKTAIGYIKNGWNPYYETAEEYYSKNNMVPKIDSKTALWIEHYPKATWIISGTIYSFTNNIESGKCVTIILDLILFLLLLDFLNKKINKAKSFFISFLACSSPIVIVQIFNYYIDGLLGICFALQSLILYLIIKNKDKKHLYLLLLSVITIIVNLKFTGLLFSGIISFIFYFYIFFKSKKSEKMKDFWNITKWFVVIYILAIFLVGGNSYVTNAIDHHNPLYPLMGKDKVDIITSMQPNSFNNKTSSYKFIVSLFSKSANISYESGLSPELKLPILIYRKELENISFPDTRISGFGPWFTFALIISVISLIIYLPKLYKKYPNKFKIILLFLILIIISMLSLSERWWARYVPQLYFIPIISLITLCLINSKNSDKICNILFYIIGAVLLINSLLFVYGKKEEIINFSLARDELILMSKENEVKINLSVSDYYGVLFNLRDYKINYKIIDEMQEDTFTYKFNWKVKVKNE